MGDKWPTRTQAADADLSKQPHSQLELALPEADSEPHLADALLQLVDTHMVCRSRHNLLHCVTRRLDQLGCDRQVVLRFAQADDTHLHKYKTKPNDQTNQHQKKIDQEIEPEVITNDRLVIYSPQKL